ncbi:MAG: endonuclease Q family protein [Candidatus Diapherotrites archaeon]|uniref:Endonuclease Q family protein n=1 Tax=Candidatus Iainarchaeum sp. TaxID=3101447 RepID=A0A7J4JYZ0_9ARCH|nr:endonuclease Q family protein [Candidatus Diapherotrites archaeon]HIH21077.1 endonuclease Q family protein [Candidatus Diapherotrites archaeon]HIH33452.1 endonuclease Q family protein [Candidatus Diapherotrites archaeon]
MEEFNLDLHFHGPFAGGTSNKTTIPLAAEQAALKGLDCITTADITHAEWLKQVKENVSEDSNGVFKCKGFGTKFIIGTEVETIGRVHHLVFLEDLARAEEFRERLKKFANLDYYGAGRPKLKLSAEQIAEIVLDLKGLIGPAHAFTPYFGVYAHYDSIQKAYGRFGKEIKFIELGLSADSYFADLIEENHRYNFFSFSDAHSVWPHRLGREFVRAKMKECSFKELKKTLEFENERRITLNVGLDPREGMYHETACNSCHAHYNLKEAEGMRWKCPCGGIIKKGVKDRISELATFKEEVHPDFRPEYLHFIPLAEIIQLTLGERMPEHKRVQEVWKQFVSNFKNEINVLIDEPIVNLAEMHEEIAKRIESFRKGLVVYKPGGGGEYGKPFICLSEQECEAKRLEIEAGKNAAKTQRTLFDY